MKPSYVLVASIAILFGVHAAARVNTDGPQRPAQVDKAPQVPPVTPPAPPPPPRPAPRPRPGEEGMPDTQVDRDPRPPKSSSNGSQAPTSALTAANSSGPAPAAAASADCSVPPWLAEESAHLDDAIVRLHKLQRLDTVGYTTTAPPTACAQQLFKYRVSVLNKIIASMEGR